MIVVIVKFRPLCTVKSGNRFERCPLLLDQLKLVIIIIIGKIFDTFILFMKSLNYGLMTSPSIDLLYHSLMTNKRDR